MPVETVNTIHDLVETNPLIDDVVREGQQHLSSVTKKALRASFPTPSPGYVEGEVPGTSRWDLCSPLNGFALTTVAATQVPGLQVCELPGLGAAFIRGGLVVPSVVSAPGLAIAKLPDPKYYPDHDIQLVFQGWPRARGVTPASFVSVGVSIKASGDPNAGEILAFPKALRFLVPNWTADIRNDAWNWGDSNDGYLYFFGSGIIFR